jgi:hypothetical protein
VCEFTQPSVPATIRERIINVHDVVKLEVVMEISVKIIIVWNVICSFACFYHHCVGFGG